MRCTWNSNAEIVVRSGLNTCISVFSGSAVKVFLPLGRTGHHVKTCFNQAYHPGIERADGTECFASTRCIGRSWFRHSISKMVCDRIEPKLWSCLFRLKHKVTVVYIPILQWFIQSRRLLVKYNFLIYAWIDEKKLKGDCRLCHKDVQLMTNTSHQLRNFIRRKIGSCRPYPHPHSPRWWVYVKSDSKDHGTCKDRILSKCRYETDAAQAKRWPYRRQRRSDGVIKIWKDVILDTNDKRFNTRIVTMRTWS